MGSIGSGHPDDPVTQAALGIKPKAKPAPKAKPKGKRK
jgi:hypothetical protein